MNDLSNSISPPKPKLKTTIPKSAIIIVAILIVFALGVSLFILLVVHNPLFFLTFLFIFSFVIGFIVWNSLPYSHTSAFFFFLESFPHSDLQVARHGQLVKITGPVSCGNVSLESSYEKVARCVYTSTLLYESRGFEFLPFHLFWRLAYTERVSTDFYIFDRNSGTRALVKAGNGCEVIPLIVEGRLVSTRRNRILSPNLTKWLTERNLSTESRLMRLEEGYVQEGNCITVIGMLHRDEDNIAMVVQPPELISTGCLWQRLLLPVDFDSLILGLTSV